MQVKKVYLPFAALVVFAGVYIAWQGLSGAISSNSNDNIPISNAEQSYEISADVAPAVVPQDKSEIDTVRAVEPESWKFTGSPAEWEERVEWFRSRGNYAMGGEDDYGSYDMESLTKLVDSGDVRAMHVLAKLYMSEQYEKEYGFKFAEPLYWSAAVHGSTDALAELAIIQDSKRFGQPDDQKRGFVIESLALYKAAELRGDRYGFLSIGKSQMKMNNIELSEDEIKYIDQKAHELYRKLSAERASIGLGEFDNSVPETVKKLFDELDSSGN